MAVTPSDKPPPGPASAERRGNGPRALSAITLRAALPLLAKRGLAEEALLSRWAEVVGPMLAAHVHPMRLVRARRKPGGEGGVLGAGGVLHLRVEGGAVALELQHRLPQVIERVNGFLGWAAVERITLHQGRLLRTRTAPVREPPPLPAERAASLGSGLEGVDDADLRAALARLGTAVGRLEAGRSRRRPG
ncbi:DUF721 domain-containing protein [Rhodospirillum rubrum]|uniref:DUF721 domain-containing protein n=1 Tax=Rhodospirillum rubrum (strain ATCC 11170 / ATH 1.1.1 / DSM 467 / LMG 4362 / NCIMB 8255 / S1) TaxID=269796 RepID=Q2RPA0_RHORT|nr:DciA family protein [Rhodospirillum rubrum]ABC24045.1 Protein of unknown function DUF1159 [Rhodospirillum rubrum ATCC 11170]AEO49789.1 hypothetical protein F11_16645 [Rhodospirillum rubrum F11]MBK5955729.1 hypothetical protein [Rhodospirillum rubrum]QXG79987.1 DUF721 domain-containing protein [Rhodospirillum rubrum]